MTDSTLPNWEQMTDLDKGAALLHLHKLEMEGTEYATSDYPAEYFDAPALTALDPASASKHAQHLFGDKDAFEVLGLAEYDRLYDLALDTDRKRYLASRRDGA